MNPMSRWRRVDRAARLVDQLREQVHVEHRSRQHHSSGKAAILAHYWPDQRVTASVDELARQLLDHDYAVVLVSSSPARAPLELSPYVRGGLTVLRKPNLGYDFGSWACALACEPELAHRDSVLLVNDSMVGPFWPLTPILERLESTTADVLSLTDSYQFGHHPQSFFVGYRRGALTEPALARFWSGIAHYEDKSQIIAHGELGLGQVLHRHGFSVAAYVPSRLVVPVGVNPVIHGWRALLDMGVPFVKRQLLTQPEVAPDASTIPEYLRQQYDIDVKEWL